MRAELLEAFTKARRVFEHLARGSRVAGLERVAQAEFEAVDAKLVGQFVHHRFVGNRPLRHAESAECARRMAVREEAAAARADIGHGVGTRRMDRDAGGDRGTPARIGASVEIGVHFTGHEPPAGVAAEFGVHPRRMAFGGGGHAFGPCVDAGHVLAGEPGREPDQRVDRHVQLAPEPAAAGRGDDPHLRGLEFHHDGHLVTVHIGRLGGDVDLETGVLALADTPGPAGLGFDVGVLDEAGFEGAFGHRCALCKGAGRIALAYAAILQQVARLVREHERRARGHRRIEAEDGGQGFIADGQGRFVDAFDRFACADQCDHSLAAKPRFAVGEDGLVLDVRVDAEAVGGDVLRGEDAFEARRAFYDCGEVAEREARMVMG